MVGGGAVPRPRRSRGLLDGGGDRARRRPPRSAASVRVARRQLGASGPTRVARSSGYRLVVACTDDPAVNQAVFDDGEAAGVWVNAADDPDRCSYTLPARLDRGRAARHGVAPAGHSPALAAWLRDQLAAPGRTGVRHAARAAGGGTSRAAWRRGVRPSVPIGDRPSIRGCWTSSGPVVSPRPGSSSRPPSPPPIRPSRVPFARRPPRVRRRHRAEPPEHAARPARADDHR